MPLPPQTTLADAAQILEANIFDYNNGREGPRYNEAYAHYIHSRQIGIDANGGLVCWIAGNASQSMLALLNIYGMNQRGSALVDFARLRATLANFSGASVSWIENISLPLLIPPSEMRNPATGETLSNELAAIYAALFAPGAITETGGYVASSKAMHCLFPALVPMIDGAHTGTSYYHIVRDTYTPPMGLGAWQDWLGQPLNGLANPCPQGAGRNAWGADQPLAAIGINQHLYEIWIANDADRDGAAFHNLDPTLGTTGIPRIVDKGLW